MKKILFMTFLITYSVLNVYALEVRSNNVMTNSVGAEITEKQYAILSEKYMDSQLDYMDQKFINIFTDSTINKKSYKIYTITTYILNNNDQVVDQKSMIATKEQAEATKTNENLYVSSFGLLSEKNTRGFVNDNYYSTESKCVEIEYYYSPNDDDYTIRLRAEWFKMPLVRQFDVMAVRWDNPVNIKGFYGYQASDVGTTYYQLDGTNMKRTSTGLGESMNLYNDAEEIQLEINIYSDNSFGSNIYGTYQHARHSNATLSISKSYTFGSSGLGGVLVFSNPTYRSYYDGMQGVKWQSTI